MTLENIAAYENHRGAFMKKAAASTDDDDNKSVESRRLNLGESLDLLAEVEQEKKPKDKSTGNKVLFDDDQNSIHKFEATSPPSAIRGHDDHQDIGQDTPASQDTYHRRQRKEEDVSSDIQAHEERTILDKYAMDQVIIEQYIEGGKILDDEVMNAIARLWGHP